MSRRVVCLLFLLFSRQPGDNVFSHLPSHPDLFGAGPRDGQPFPPLHSQSTVLTPTAEEVSVSINLSKISQRKPPLEKITIHENFQMHPGLHLAALGNFPAIVQLLISVPDIQVLLYGIDIVNCHRWQYRHHHGDNNHHHFNQMAQVITPHKSKLIKGHLGLSVRQ